MLSDDQFGAEQVGWMRTKDLRPTERYLDDAAKHMRSGNKPALRGYLDNMKSYVQEHGYPGPIEVKQYPGQGPYGDSGNRAIRKNTPMVMQGHHRRWIGLELKHEYVPVKLDRGSVVPSSFTTERPPGAPGIAPDPDVERTWMPESWGRSLP